MNLPAVVNRAGLALKKHSPEILIVTGVVGVVTSAVMACKATKKLDPILEDHEALMDRVRQEEDPAELKSMTTKVYVSTAAKVAKLYAPAVGLGVASLACIIGSNQILRKRNVALAASAAALNKGFQEYRERVTERFGEEVEKQIFYNLQPEEVEETVTDDKGKEKKIKKTVGVVDPNLTSPFSKYFTKSNVNWKNDDDWNKTFVSLRQSYFNDVLKAKGSLTLNEVYREMGFKETKEGMINGWFYDPDDPNLKNFVQLTATEVYLHNENGQLERALAIDFNVDGDIYDMMV